MQAVITIYGGMNEDSLRSPLAVLDLLLVYDCLYYGAYGSFEWYGGEAACTQYGPQLLALRRTKLLGPGPWRIAHDSLSRRLPGLAPARRRLGIDATPVPMVPRPGAVDGWHRAETTRAGARIRVRPTGAQRGSLEAHNGQSGSAAGGVSTVADPYLVPRGIKSRLAGIGRTAGRTPRAPHRGPGAGSRGEPRRSGARRGSARPAGAARCRPVRSGGPRRSTD